MEVAASIPNILRIFPLRIMAKEDFHSSQQVAVSSLHGEAAAINADEELEEGEWDIRKYSMEPGNTWSLEQQDLFGNGGGPSLAYHLGNPYPNPSPNLNLSNYEENLASVSSPATPRSPPLNNMHLECSVDALLSLPDKYSLQGQSRFCNEKFPASSPAPSSGNECQASSPAGTLRAFSPSKQALISSPSSARQFQTSLSAPVKEFQASSPPNQFQASLRTEQPAPLKELQAPSLKEPRVVSPASLSGNLYQASSPAKKPPPLPHSRHGQSSSPPSSQLQASSLLQASSPVKQFQASSPPNQSQASLLSVEPWPLEERKVSPLQVSSPLEHPQASSPPKHFLSFPSTDQTQLSSPTTTLVTIQGNSKKRPRPSAVRDFPEGCGKNVSVNTQVKEQKLGALQEVNGASGEVLPHPRRPVMMMKDEAALCLYKSQKMCIPLLKTQKSHVYLKWKQEGSSPTDLKKPKVRQLSRILNKVKERPFQIEWLQEEESFGHIAGAERPLKLQNVSSRKERLPLNGSISARKLPKPDPLEGSENLLSFKGSSGASARSLVKRTLQEFDCIRRSLAMTKNCHQRPDLAAATILRSKGMWRNCAGGKVVGEVPGVEVGDQFSFRIEMLVIGLHRQVQGGIDYITGSKRPKGPLATSIVASGGYEDDDDSGATFIYTGQGGNNYKGDRRQASDQVLQRGNLALSNSFKEKSPVRVIRGSTDDKLYTYDGLYDVVDCWFQTGASGFGVFQVKLSRRPGQPELGSSLVKFMGNSKMKGLARPHLLVADISNGKERLPICVVNEVDEEAAPLVFTYIPKMKYPSWCHPEPSRGCNCKDGCVDASKCLCAAKNGGQFPYNEIGQIVRGKKVVFECGKSCACSSSCFNRVSQKGTKYKLEIFKTRKRGWGVRSLNPIRPGDLICEYAGELLSDSDAERRTGCDEYLFDIGNMMSWNDDSGLMGASMEKAVVPLVEDAGFTIDARLFGNVARFINHSCSPNLFAQNVVYDTDDLRFPHVVLFSMENVPPMRELSYDYNYSIGHVRDANGNVKVKACYCGAQDCKGRLY